MKSWGSFFKIKRAQTRQMPKADIVGRVDSRVGRAVTRLADR